MVGRFERSLTAERMGAAQVLLQMVLGQLILGAWMSVVGP